MEATGATKRPSYDQRLEAEAKQRGIDPHLYAALKIALGTAAYCGIAQQILADPVRFNNPPVGDPLHYRWAPADELHPDNVPLDITKSPFEQLEYLTGPGGFYHIYAHSYVSDYNFESLIQGAIGQSQILNAGGLPGFADPLTSGALIGPASPFDPDWLSINARIAYNYPHYDGYKTDLPLYTPVYLAARWWNGTQSNVYFGWIEVALSKGRLEALAWGYESNPNTPVVAGADPQCPLPGCYRIDIENGDCRVSLEDLAGLLAHYGQIGPDVPGDIDLNGMVDLSDLTTMLQAYGRVCE